MLGRDPLQLIGRVQRRSPHARVDRIAGAAFARLFDGDSTGVGASPSFLPGRTPAARVGVEKYRRIPKHTLSAVSLLQYGSTVCLRVVVCVLLTTLV